MMKNVEDTFEVNLDGMIGPTHNYSGLSFGNIASTENFQLISNPKQAAKQGLEKMRFLANLGIKQLIMPPQERPYIPFLRSLGYEGNPEKILHQAWKENKDLLLACCSASSMWAANAATVSPSCDSEDGRVHFIPANLISKLHRSIEPPMTSHILRLIFPNPTYFVHHDPLPAHPLLGDEGAANHTRFCNHFGQPGFQLFVYGLSDTTERKTMRFTPRQTLSASQAIARLHRLKPEATLFAQQNPEAIDAGVFHNDVISVGNQNVFFFHEKAFVNSDQIIQQLQEAFLKTCKIPLILIQVKNSAVSLQEAVKTYLFNSQLITLPDQTMALVAPTECQKSSLVQSYLEQLLQDSTHPIKQVIYQDVHQSMQNGGGPACLRLRIVLKSSEYAHVHPAAIFTEELYHKLIHWIDKHYRDKIVLQDLADPHLLFESYRALDELTHILKLGSIYSFQ